MPTSTPTTKILAIGTINPGVDPAKVFAILPNEVRDTVDLYLNGKIDQSRILLSLVTCSKSCRWDRPTS